MNRSIDKKREDIRRRIESKLSTTGELQKIRKHIRTILTSSGWMDHIKTSCRDLIRQKGVENCTVEEIVEAILPQARELVPKELKQEVLDMLWKFVDDHNVGLEDEEDDAIKSTM